MPNPQRVIYFLIAGVFTLVLIIVGILTSTRSFDENLVNSTPIPQTSESIKYVGEGCKIGGCSGTICVGETAEDPITTCEYKNDYACYKTAICEKQENGQCGWTQTDELKSCLNNPPTGTPEVEVSI